MKCAISTACLIAAFAAAATPPPGVVELPSYDLPAGPWTDIAAPSRELACRDRIERLRAEAGRPATEGETANPEKPLKFHAVDQRIGGCGVLMPVADPSDLRRSPPPGEPKVVPAR